MRTIKALVELEVTKTEFYDFTVEIEVPEDYDVDLQDAELLDKLEDEAAALARAEYWQTDQLPYDSQTDEFNTLNVELWD